MKPIVRHTRQGNVEILFKKGFVGITSNKEEAHRVTHACLCSWGSREKRCIHIAIIKWCLANRVYISQLIRYARASSLHSYFFFNNVNIFKSNFNIKSGLLKNRLYLSFNKVSKRYQQYKNTFRQGVGNYLFAHSWLTLHTI
jgi:hypothetical protein